MKWRAINFALVICCGLAVACGDDDGRVSMVDAGGQVDAGFDAGPPLPDAGPYIPVTLYTEVALPDVELAEQAFAILAGDSDDNPRCSMCHGLTQERVRAWGATTVAGLGCIGSMDPNVPADATAILACFDTHRSPDPASMGLLTTAVHLEWFRRTLEVEHGEEMGMGMESDRFIDITKMPKPPVAELTQDDVDILLTWATRGMPDLENVIDGGGTRCVPSIGTAAISAHLTAMETEGWGVLNRDDGVRMFGCAAGETGADCLTSFPDQDAAMFSNGWAQEGTIRVLFETDYRSSFWTRSSADGRFVSHGGGPGSETAAIIDLQRDVVIGADALYDPGFFPDNSGFVLQGVSSGNGGFCAQRLLEAEPARVTFREPECTVLSAVGLYQHMAAVRGGDYWSVFGQFVSDNGGHDVTIGPLETSFGPRSRVSLTPLVYTGDTYSARSTIRVSTPDEGDAVISPSGRLLLSRLAGPGDTQSGYVLRRIDATPDGMGSYTIDLPVLAQYCMRGTKVGFSFDERYVTFHRYLIDADATDYGYTGPDDPGWTPYQMQGAADVFVMDIETGDVRRITRMNPGQYALFPHFRSDGWIYFIVRDPVISETREHVAASDAALHWP